MDPTTQPPIPPDAPEPETNPVPPPEPQPESATPKSHSKVFAAQFQSPASANPQAATVTNGPTVSSKPGAQEDQFESPFALYKPSWIAVQRNLSSFIWLTLVPGLILGVASLLTAHFHKQHAGTGNVLSLIGGLYTIAVLAAVPLLSLRAAKGQTTDPMTVLKDSWHYFWRVLGLYIVIGVITLVGFILFIVPGFIMIRRYFLAAYFLIDQDVGISEAMNHSAAATKGYTGPIFGVIGVEILLGLFSIIPLVGSIVGVFAELPYSCAPAIRYLEFKDLAKRASVA